MSQSLIRMPETMRRTGYGRAWIYKLIAQGRFPKPVKLARERLLSLRVKLTSGLISVLRNHAEQLPD